MNGERFPARVFAVITLSGLAMAGCGGSSDGSSSSASTSASSSSSSATSSQSSASSTSSATSSSSSSSTSGSSCSTGSSSGNALCAVKSFEATLDSTQLANVQTYSDARSGCTKTSYTSNILKTYWSNLPGDCRAGIPRSSMSTAQATAYDNVAYTALSAAGYEEWLGLLAADNYLGTIQSGYGEGYAHIAVIGAPSASTDSWALMFGNHHMAFNLNYASGSLYPTPRHLGIEPKAQFSYGGSTWHVGANKAATMLAVFYGATNSMTSTQLSTARLTNLSFSDVLVGPGVEKTTGSYTNVMPKFPTGGSQGTSSYRGIAVTSLSSEAQALVKSAIQEWTNDYDSSTATNLYNAYTDSTAWASTYVAWQSSASYPNVETSGTYMRIDGPRVWIEITAQGGLVIQGATHYHMVYRDKKYDYGDRLGYTTDFSGT